MTDQDGNELIQPSYQREKQAYEDVWAVYRFTLGFHSGQRVTDYMTLSSAREEAGKRNDEVGDGASCYFTVYRLYRYANRRKGYKPGRRKW